MQQAVVSETIRFRRDTVPGYNEAFNHAQHDFYGPLWLAEIDHPPTLLDHQLKKKAAVYLFRSLIDPIRAASQPQISSGTQGVTSQS